MNNAKYKILHIDDEDFFLDYFTMSYQAFFKITPVSNGMEAIDKFRSEAFDAVITDYEMPDYNGLELMKIFREESPDIPVIFYTSQGNENIAREVFISGASDYFSKEINKFAHREKFVHSVISAIEKNKAKQALKYRHNFEQIIISLSRKIMNQPVEVIDETINEALKTISRFEKIEHSFIILSSENSDEFICTHEWRNEDVTSTFLKKETVTTEQFPWIAEEIEKNEIIQISGSESLPSEAVREKIIFQRENIQSILIIALRYETKNLGIMGLVSHFQDKVWSDEFKNLIRIAADIITGAIMRKKHEEELFKHRESLEDIVKERTMMLIDINRKLKQEIAGRTEVGETLRKSEEKYRRIFNNIQDVYFEAGIDGMIYEVSPSVQLISDFKREELLSTSIYKRYMNPADRDEILKKLIKSGHMYDYEIILKNKDGSPIYCSVNSKLELDKNGKPYKLVGTIRNIAARKRVEDELKRYKEQLLELVEDRTRQLLITNESLKKEILENEKVRQAIKESEMKYKELFERFQDIFYNTDINGIITLISPSVERVMGYKAEEVIGKSMAETAYVHPSQRAEFLELLNSKGEISNYIAQLKKKDGTKRWVSTNARFLRDKKGEIIGVEGITRDITDQKKLMDELIKKNNELEDFAYRISHDLKNPLILINGFVSSISEYPDLFIEFFPRIMTLTEKLAKVIDNLLKLSRAGRVIERKEMIDTEQLIQETFMLMSDREIPSRIIIESPIPQINGDPDSIREMFSCLIANSFRFKDPAKAEVLINISGEQMNGQSIVRFRDNGMGIKEEHLEKIFNPGFAHSIQRGTGFGLAIVQKIVRAHDGKVIAKSDGENKGSEFTFTFS